MIRKNFYASLFRISENYPYANCIGPKKCELKINLHVAIITRGSRKLTKNDKNYM